MYVTALNIHTSHDSIDILSTYVTHISTLILKVINILNMFVSNKYEEARKEDNQNNMVLSSPISQQRAFEETFTADRRRENAIENKPTDSLFAALFSTPDYSKVVLEDESNPPHKITQSILGVSMAVHKAPTQKKHDFNDLSEARAHATKDLSSDMELEDDDDCDGSSLLGRTPGVPSDEGKSMIQSAVAYFNNFSINLYGWSEQETPHVRGGHHPLHDDGINCEAGSSRLRL